MSTFVGLLMFKRGGTEASSGSHSHTGSEVWISDKLGLAVKGCVRPPSVTLLSKALILAWIIYTVCKSVLMHLLYNVTLVPLYNKCE